MEGTGSLYSSKETITSPVKSFMEQHKHIQLHLQNKYDGDNTTITNDNAEEKSNLSSYLLNLDKLKETAVNASKNIKNVIGSLKDRFNEARSKIIRKEHDNEEEMKAGNDKQNTKHNGKNVTSSTSPTKLNSTTKQNQTTTTTSSKKKKGTQKSRIFVTRSSKEFAQIQIDNKFASTSTSNATTKNDALFLTPLVGAGIVALPYALKHSGFILGILLILFVLICMDYGEMLLIQCVACSSSGEQQPVNIATVSRESFGRIGYLVYFGFPFAFQFCILMAYFVIISDTGVKCVEALLTAVLPSHSEDGTASGIVVQRNIVIVILFISILLPISMIKSGEWVARFSYLSLIAGSLVSVLVTVRAFTLRDQIPRISMTSYHAVKSSGGTNIVQAVAVVVFTFLCQHTVRLTYMRPRLATTEVDAPHNPTDKPADFVSAFLLLINMTVSCGGYTTFNVFTQGDLLENYCQEDLLAGLTRVMFTIFVASLFPLECMNLRLMTDELVLVHHKFKNIFHVTVTCIFLLPIFITSLFIDCLPLVLEATGVLLAIPITFVLPSLLFLKQSSGNHLSREKIPCILFMSVGIVLSVTGFAVTVFSNHSCIHSTMLLPYCNGSSELVGPLITLMSLNDDVTATMNDDAILMMNFTTTNSYINMSRLEQYGFENLTDVVNAYLA